MDKIALRFFPILIIFFEITLYLSNDMYLPAMPTIAAELDFTQNQIQSTLTFWFLGASSLQLILGPISDRYGRKSVVGISCVFFILSSIACAMVETLGIFLVARFIQGTAICSLLAAYAAIHELFSTKQAIKLLALVSSITILAPALGPLFGALIVMFTEWRYIFWLLTAMGILSLISIIFYMPESNLNRSPINIRHTITDYKKIISNRNFLLPSISYFLLVVIEFAWIFESPFIIMEVFKASPLYYGIAQTIIFSFYLVGAIATKWMLEKYNVMKFVKISLAITIIGTVLMFFTSLIYNNLVMAICSMCVVSLGSSMLLGPLNRIAIESCNQPMGRRTAVFFNGISLAGALTGWILEIMNSDGLLPIATLIIICMFITTLLVSKVKNTTND